MKASEYLEQIMSEDFVDKNFVKVVLASKPGRAKSTAGMSFPLPQKLYLFDGEAKIPGPLLYLAKMGVDLSQIHITIPKDWNNNWISFDQQLQEFKRSPNPYKSFGFDSLTSVADNLMGFTAAGKLRADPKKIKQTGGVQVASIDEYNAELSGIMDIILFMMEVQAHVWFSAHIIETDKQNLETNTITKVSSLLSGGKKAAARLPAYFPECYKLEKESGFSSSDPTKYIFYTHGPDDDYARTNFNLPMKIDFTNRKFFDVLIEEIKKGRMK